MTKRSFAINILIAILILIIILTVGILLSIFDHNEKRIIYTTFKDLIPLVLAIIAAWLTYCIQRRTSYLQHMRILWSKTIDAVQTADQYTRRKQNTQKEHSDMLLKISVVIDEIRGIYKNIEERKDKEGYYPFEPIKEIYTLMTDVGYGENIEESLRKDIREKVFVLWKSMRKEFLKEFDRDKPTFSHSHWIDEEKLTITKGRQPS